MKRIPYVTSHAAKTERITSVFGGINQSVVAGDGEFADMENMSCRDYPAISTRKNNIWKKDNTALSAVHGMHYMRGVLVSYGQDVNYYSGTYPVCTYTNVLTNTNKIIADIGGKFVVFPDKKTINPSYGAMTVSLSYDQMNSSTNAQRTITISKEDDGIVLTTSSVLVEQGRYPFDRLNDDDVILVKIKKTNQSGYEINGVYTVSEALKLVDQNGKHTISFKINCSDWPWQSEDPFVAYETRAYRYVPNFDYVIEVNNRLWGCRNDADMWPDGVTEISGSQVQCCKLGDPKNWFNYQGTSMDAYAATIGVTGDFTGAISYGGHPVFMKRDKIITIYGDKPSNFQTVVKNFPGAVSNDSMVILNDVLYYVADDGVYAYNGTTPRKISDNIKDKIWGGVAWKYDGKYYLSCNFVIDGDFYPVTLCYDPEKGIWDIEKKEEALYACDGDGKGYYISGENGSYYLYSMGDGGSGSFDWMLESVDMREDSIDMKYISKLKFNVWLDSGAEATIYMKYDDSPLWERVGEIKSDTNKTYVFPVIPKRCNKFRWKMTGKGHAKLLAVGRTIEGGSEPNGNV